MVALRDAEATTVRIERRVVRQKIGLHVDHHQRVIGPERRVGGRSRAAREAEPLLEEIGVEELHPHPAELTERRSVT